MRLAGQQGSLSAPPSRAGSHNGYKRPKRHPQKQQMITKGDDWPIHQTAEPVAYPGTSDRNFYERYFFHGYDIAGSAFFAATFALYPNRRLVDGAFNVVWQGQQYIVRASALFAGDRLVMEVGPLHIRVREPLRTLELSLAPNAWGIAAQLVFEGRTPPLEEPRFVQRSGTRLWMDYTRITQLGRWSGWLDVAGKRSVVTPEVWVGARDRSWGIRPVGEPEAGVPVMPLQFFWLWGPFHFPDFCVHFDVAEYAEGTRWHEYAAVFDEQTQQCAAAGSIEHSLQLRPGTRQIAAAQVRIQAEREYVLDLQPVLHFYMAGLGYGHPEWGHGRYLGDSLISGDTWELNALNPGLPLYFHVQTVCRVRAGGADGIGVLEQLMIGPHTPTRLKGLFDPAEK